MKTTTQIITIERETNATVAQTKKAMLALGGGIKQVSVMVVDKTKGKSK